MRFAGFLNKQFCTWLIHTHFIRTSYEVRTKCERSSYEVRTKFVRTAFALRDTCPLTDIKVSVLFLPLGLLTGWLRVLDASETRGVHEASDVRTKYFRPLTFHPPCGSTYSLSLSTTYVDSPFSSKHKAFAFGHILSEMVIFKVYLQIQ